MSASRGSQRKPVKWSVCEETTFIVAEGPGLSGTAPEQGAGRSPIHYPPLPLKRQPSFFISRLLLFHLRRVKNVELGNK